MSGSESGQRVDEVASAIGDSSHAVLNLARLRFVTSTFLGMLVALRRETQTASVSLKLCGPNPTALEALSIAKMDQLFQIYDDEQAALNDI